MSSADKDLSKHAQIAERIIGNIVQASGPAVSPDGSTVAFVVSRVDMVKNKNFSQVWLAAADGSTAPRAVTGGDHDSSPAWSPDGRSLAFASKRGAEEGRKHAARAAGRRARRDPHDRDDERRRRRGVLEPRRSLDRLHQPHPRRALRRRGRQLAGTAQGRAVLQQARQRGLDLRPTRTTSTSSPPTAPARRATSHPASSSTVRSRGSPTPAGWCSAHNATTPGTSTSRVALYSVSLDGDDRRARRSSTASYDAPDGVAGRNHRGVPRRRRLADLSAERRTSASCRSSGGEHRWLSRQLDRTFETTAGGACRAVARRRRPCCSAPRIAARRTCTASPSTAASPKALTSGPIVVNSFDAAGGTIAYAAARSTRSATSSCSATASRGG